MKFLKKNKHLLIVLALFIALAAIAAGCTGKASGAENKGNDDYVVNISGADEMPHGTDFGSTDSPSMNLVARGGSVVFFGLYGMDYNLELNLFTLYWKDATLSAVCVPSGQFPAAIAGQLKLEEVISRELSFSKGIEAFREKSSGREAKVMLRFEQEGSIC